MAMTRKVLIVCLGNICRSPAAEVLLRVRARAAGHALEVDSAGTGHWHVGAPPHPPMIAAARARGYDLAALRARQVTAADFARFDLILAADPSNRDSLERLRPAGDATPVRLLASYAGRGADTVPDPYFTGDYDGALDLIEAATDGVVAQLQ